MSLKKTVFSKPGDIWRLGKHAVICGDSTLPKTYEKLMGTTKANLVCTDPPYLVNLQSTSGTIANDDLNDKDAYEDACFKVGAVLAWKKLMRRSYEPTGSSTWSRSSSVRGRMASTSGTTTRSRRRSSRLRGSRIPKKMAADILPASRYR